jgi:hypothetical protein
MYRSTLNPRKVHEARSELRKQELGLDEVRAELQNWDVLTLLSHQPRVGEGGGLLEYLALQ